jgi:nitrogen fixation protein FixH
MAIVGLLSLSVIASLLTVFAARSDGGAQVIDDYYHKAANWDSTRALQAASDALGWQVDLTAEPAQGTARIVRLHLQNKHGEPVIGLQGTISAFRPQQAQMVDEAALIETEPGVYQQQLTMPQPGLWDFEIDATRDGTPFLKRIRLEVAR